MALKNHCPSAHRALAYYRLRHKGWLELRGVKTRFKLSQPFGCAHTRWLVDLTRKRAVEARESYYRWREWKQKHMLRDFEFRPGNHAWHKAVREVQKIFPGTEAWLLSCSDAEGGHGRWVGYGGVSYSTGLRDSNTVGGPMQFRFGTFTGMWRNAYEFARSRAFFVPFHLRDLNSRDGLTISWRSALGQAMAAGWARFTGNDDSHWSASWGNGC